MWVQVSTLVSQELMETLILMQLHEREFCLCNVTRTEDEVLSVGGCDHLKSFFVFYGPVLLI